MLRSLSIRNFAIIDRLEIEFQPGLNVLTGETGAGKSILMGALNTILGGRAGVEMVRAGADRATVDAVFDVSSSPGMLRALEESGFEAEDGQLLLTREITAAGKSSARICGRPAAVAQLREIGDSLVDLHGQHEHQSLLSIPRHIQMLDEWGGPEILSLRSEVGGAYRDLRSLEEERASLERDARERARLIDLYTFQAREISEAALAEDEEQDLKADSRRLANAQKLAESAARAAADLTGDSGVVESLSSLVRSLQGAAELDDRLTPLTESVCAAMYSLEEAARELAHYEEAIEHDPERLQQVEERLELISGLKRKYGETVEEIIAYGRDVGGRLEALGHSEERGQELDEEIAAAAEKLSALCGDLTTRRRKLGREFADCVMTELRDLGMERTRFEVRIEPGDPNPTGADRVEFLLGANPGEPLRPLARIASGGEVSRLMLAIKSAMARQDPLPTMVFDEIDAGVGGRTASVLGEKLAALARNAQILCITHLPQIAGRAGAHYYIEKRVVGDRTSVSVSPLLNGGRVEELARMLGGANITETVLQHAREMLKSA